MKGEGLAANNLDESALLWLLRACIELRLKTVHRPTCSVCVCVWPPSGAFCSALPRWTNSRNFVLVDWKMSSKTAGLRCIMHKFKEEFQLAKFVICGCGGCFVDFQSFPRIEIELRLIKPQCLWGILVRLPHGLASPPLHCGGAWSKFTIKINVKYT